MRGRFLFLATAVIVLMGDAYAQVPLVSLHEMAKGAGGEQHTISALTGSAVTGSRETCMNGSAAGFDCRNIDLLSFLPIDALGGGSTTKLNDIWGWTDQQTGRDYALVGRSDGTSFVDITDPVNPVFIGDLPSHDTTRSVWRDVKVLGDYAVIVADNPVGPDMKLRSHGMQIFDLRNMRDVSNPPVTFAADHVYDEFGKAHNIAVNPQTEFAYAVGSETCGGGLHMVDLSEPLEPAFAGCFADLGTGRHGSGYTHDVQCVIYDGPDADYQGREICFGSNETHVSIADVTDKGNPEAISRTDYPFVKYTHQSWLTPDHRYILLDDELDELHSDDVQNTRTLIFDVVDLDDPQLITEYIGVSTSIDHNQFVVESRSFQANYTSGLRVLDISNVLEPEEIGFFDTYAADDGQTFDGAWSNYPFFESGVVIVSSISEGLFVLDPVGPAATDDAVIELPDDFTLLAAYPNPFNPSTTIRLEIDRPQHVRVTVYDVQGREVASLFNGFVEAASTREFTFDAKDLASGTYVVRASGEGATGSITVTLQK
jgi:choice-of-anchor B domain-containing protein